MRTQLLNASQAAILLGAIAFPVSATEAAPAVDTVARPASAEILHLSDQAIKTATDRHQPAQTAIPAPSKFNNVLPPPDPEDPPILSGSHLPDGPDHAADGSPRHPISKQGIEAAMVEIKPALYKCTRTWAQQNPSARRMGLEFKITQPPGKNVDMINQVIVSRGTDAGAFHEDLECRVLNAVRSRPFEPPLNGQTDVTYLQPVSGGIDAGAP